MTRISVNLLSFVSLLCLINVTLNEPIRGITIRNWPYANRLENGQFEGLVVDLLNEISRIAKITYTLELSEDKDYGGWSKNGTVTGMIGKVFRNESDFAIGDITRLSTRDRYVHFSYPFMKFGLSALIHKDNVGNMSSFKELSEQSEVAYGVKKVGANLPLFHNSPVVTKMFNYMDANPSTFVMGEQEGISRAKSSKFAFITESPFNEYTMNRDCDLTVIDDKMKNFQFEYGIAMRKNLVERYAVSDAIRHLKKNGFLEQLKDKYWKTDKCVEETNNTQAVNVNVQEVNQGVVGRLSGDPTPHDKLWPPNGPNHENRKKRPHGHPRNDYHKKNSAVIVHSLPSQVFSVLLLVLFYVFL